MLGNHKDRERTKAARESGEFEDPRSYYSIAGHVYLRGNDRSERRMLVWIRSNGKCALCFEKLTLRDCDMDHIKGGTKHARCDCLRTILADGTEHTNVRAVHGMFSVKPCHRVKHHRESPREA
jgi:hypothetical protein